MLNVSWLLDGSWNTIFPLFYEITKKMDYENMIYIIWKPTHYACRNHQTLVTRTKLRCLSSNCFAILNCKKWLNYVKKCWYTSSIILIDTFAIQFNSWRECDHSQRMGRLNSALLVGISCTHSCNVLLEYLEVDRIFQFAMNKTLIRVVKLKLVECIC